MGPHKFKGLIGLFFSVAVLASAHAANPPQPTNLTLTHRSGQTFITWTEQRSLTGECYRIYRHSQPVTRDNVFQATLLYQVAEGSGRFFADRYNVEYSGVWRARYNDRFVIAELGEQLATNTGLLVWTLAPVDFGGGSTGSAYYAVTTVDHNGRENAVDFTTANTRGPVVESVNDPSPVEIRRGTGGLSHVYTQFMDLRHFNPTFHAPNASNNYYGLNSANPAVTRSIQYAYTYTVGEPDPANCPSPMPAKLPVVLNLHGWADNTYGPDLSASQYYCCFEIRPIDVSQTWWFGFARKQDYRESITVGPGDDIVNFTEARVLRMVYDLLRDPAFASRIDRERIFEYGHSMGGSGALALALRYPNVFAAGYASEPMTNYRSSLMWQQDLSLKWGTAALNLPVLINGPGGWAEHLERFNRTGVWDWQNHRRNAQKRAGDDFVPFGVAHGRRDDVIDWATQGKPAYTAFDAGRHTWGGAVTDDDHTWLSFAGLPPNYAVDQSWAPFAGMRAVRNETVPGLSRASGNLALPPPDPPGPLGGYNESIEWSSSWRQWDGPPVDRPGLWALSLRTTDGSTQTVDVTPRRLANFKVASGMRYRWQNRAVTDNQLLASGMVKADAGNLVTIPGLRITPSGNRIRLTPLRSWPDTTRGIHVFNDQLMGGLSEPQVRFAATHYAGTQKATRSEANRLRAVNPDFLILHYRLGLGLGYREIEGACQPSGAWLRVIEADRWVREWPGDDTLQENWFFHWPASSSTRVLNCDWGWYLVETNDPGFRSYWHDEVLRQVRVNGNDGVFMDSLSVPNYLGADRYNPPLPGESSSFEGSWANRITSYLSWLQRRTLGGYYLVANVGQWITSRETTSYSPADGLMVEQFAIEADDSPYALDDWRLQMNRIIAATNRSQALLAQTYAIGRRERMFALGSYLLVKGKAAYLNIDLGQEPEWWPEYDIPLGRPTSGAHRHIDELDQDGDRIYRRNFDNGLVLVNPSNPWDGTGVTRTIALEARYYLASTTGGGTVPPSGIPDGAVSYRAVTSVTLKPYSAAVLLKSRPASLLRRNENLPVLIDLTAEGP